MSGKFRLMSNTGGKFLLSPGGYFAVHKDCCCGGPCGDLSCDTEDQVCSSTVADCADGDCSCLDGMDYTFSYENEGLWEWTSGYTEACPIGPNEYFIEVTCQEDGDWLIVVRSYISGFTLFTGTATTSQLTCIDGSFSGTVTIPGYHDEGHSGPDCTDGSMTITW